MCIAGWGCKYDFKVNFIFVGSCVFLVIPDEIVLSALFGRIWTPPPSKNIQMSSTKALNTFLVPQLSKSKITLLNILQLEVDMTDDIKVAVKSFLCCWKALNLKVYLWF